MCHWKPIKSTAGISNPCCPDCVTLLEAPSANICEGCGSAKLSSTYLECSSTCSSALAPESLLKEQLKGLDVSGDLLDQHPGNR